jgi:hypothetical protein
MLFLLWSKAAHFLLVFIHLSKHFIHVVHEFQTKNNVVSDLEMDSQTVRLSLFELEESFLLEIGMLEI